MRVIDMECNVPSSRRRADGAGGEPGAAPAATERPAGYGMANYERIFRSRSAGGDPRRTPRWPRT
jgi:hypothetical protein